MELAASSIEIADQWLSEQSTPLNQRPMAALMYLLEIGAVEFNIGHEALTKRADVWPHVQKPWFRAVFDAFEEWYLDKYGSRAMEAKGTEPLWGVVVIAGVPFLMSGEANRSEVDEEAETAWMCFEEELGSDEDALNWIVDCPDFSKFSSETQDRARCEAEMIANTMRFIEFRRVCLGPEPDVEVGKLLQSTMSYLAQFSKRLIGCKKADLSLAWFDLQMANETALKSVILKATGKQKKGHWLTDLLKIAKKNGVEFDAVELVDWPEFGAMSAMRYGQGGSVSLTDVYAAYYLSLRLIYACMQVIPVFHKSGFRLLLRYNPWSARNASGEYRK